MCNDLSHILVFKTNIRTVRNKKRVQRLLENREGLLAFNVDQQDSDCVLRVVAATITAKEVKTLLQEAGFECAELD
ncbi:hypothetical protein LQ567_22000 [Niabella pedocola]|uniref:HMA domain-containing protein n=1 Tax=Niabella pedocola TaxID=1752077 RepID=A0ABS8PWM8_9BACT|nr:hypothetical protein [Niabella pedocola]MCD2425473.1 hypothetical protein [Niabella pedocola]